jgi:polysaccharide deacetylase 2 family uncharacterized protein YibQ
VLHGGGSNGPLERFAFFVSRLSPAALALVALATLLVGVIGGVVVGLRFAEDETAPPAATEVARLEGHVDPGSTADLKGYPGRPDNPNQYKPPPLPRPGLPPPLKPMPKPEERAKAPDPTAPQPFTGMAPPIREDVRPPVQTAALPKEFQDLLRSDGGTPYVMEERLPAETYVHKPDQVKPVPLPEDLALPEPDHGPGDPPWKRYALASAPTQGPRVAVVIDDLGPDRKRTGQVRDLKGPLTMAYLAYTDDLASQMRSGRKAGHEIIMHMPMEPLNGDVNPGRDALKVGLSDEEILARLRRNLDRGAEFVGINNHMGSRFTADRRGMSLVMGELRKRGLLWLDSVTSPKTVGLALATAAGVPRAGRSVFLDNVPDTKAVMAQLAKLEAAARENGSAIGIGHPKDATISALRAWLPTLARKGITLVPLTALTETGNQTLAGRL